MWKSFWIYFFFCNINFARNFLTSCTKWEGCQVSLEPRAIVQRQTVYGQLCRAQSDFSTEKEFNAIGWRARIFGGFLVTSVLWGGERRAPRRPASAPPPPPPSPSPSAVGIWSAPSAVDAPNRSRQLPWLRITRNPQTARLAPTDSLTRTSCAWLWTRIVQWSG